ncbi:unnamed protein product [Ambrosiozyma monospora]|uniref:Unnamed protein product n=1 Tax=Ambrosiozyma monospora TaxID=43982 RepID=A0ACB5SSZ2_AMBMO|nr:unnamed protein product [Ambrosiozyma monospora]
MELQLTSQLHELLSRKTIKKLQVIPDSQIDDDPTLADFFKATTFPNFQDPNTNTLDILISKKQLVKIFIECHKVIDDHISNTDGLQHFSRDFINSDLMTLYSATLGIWLVTPEEHRALILNESMLIKLLSNSMISEHQDTLYRHFEILSGYLTSTIAKTNKSSSLWLYFKKTLIRLFNNLSSVHEQSSNTAKDQLFVNCIETILHSIRSHPRNYYAGSTLRFLIAVLRHSGEFEMLRIYYSKILTYLKKDGLNDYSIWLVFLQLCVNVDSEEYFIAEYNRLCEPHKKNNAPEWHNVSKNRCFNNEVNLGVVLYQDLKNLLVGSELASYSAWYVFTFVSTRSDFHDGKHRKDGFEILDFFEEQVAVFENSNNVKIDTKTAQLVSSDGGIVDLSSDLLLQEKFNLVLIFKRLLNKSW